MTAQRTCTWLVTAVIVCACATGPTPVGARPADPVDRACAWSGAPTVVARHGTATLEQWELRDDDRYGRLAVPDDADYLEFRAAIRAAGADRKRPVAEREPPSTDAEREVWRREDRNAELVHTGQVGRLRPISCLEALLFARQHRRHSQLGHPTEFIASVLRKDGRLRILIGAGDDMFPPRQVYGFDHVERAVADGWRLWFVLHNHTIQRYRGRVALGEPTLSTNDVQLFRNVGPGLGMRQARVTNGMYTVEIEAGEIGGMEGPPP